MSATDGEAPPETAEALLARLRRLDRDGRIEIVIEPRHLDHIDSPVASEADGNIWVYGLILLAVLAGAWQGLLLGLAAAAAGAVLYFTAGRAYKHRRIERRVREKGLASLATWRRLWRFRGITLRAKDQPGLADCASPDGNWMGFVRRLV
jgi:hypothetical protein